MKCSQLQSWFLEARTESALPNAVRRHLASCPDCQRRWQHLERLDKQVRQLPVPAGNPSKKEALLRRIEHVQQVRKPSLPPRRLPVYVRALGLATAASLLFFLGWFFGSPAPHP